METIVVQGASKKFSIGFEAKQGALGRVVGLVSGRVPTRTFWALTDVSFTARAGELVALVGRNGSGKSTLLRAIAGIYSLDGGSIVARGKTISLMNLYIGLKLRLTARDNIKFIGSLLGLSLAQVRMRLAQIVAFAELEPYLNTKLTQYSSGMLQRLVFSIAVHADPRILLLDEVFEIGDEEFRQKSAARINALVAGGVTVILVSHDLDLVRKHCHRTIWMDHGKIVADGTTGAILKKYLQHTTSAGN